MISSATLYRLSGLALFVGALLEIITAIAMTLLFPSNTPQQGASAPQQYLTTSWLLVALLSLVSSLLQVGGLPGVCVRQRAEVGRLGLVGFVLTQAGSILFVGINVIDLLVLPFLAANDHRLLTPPASYTTYLLPAALLVTVGVVLLGLATMRAVVFPRWVGLLLIASIVINLVSFTPLPTGIGGLVEKGAEVLYALGLAWLGSVLLAERGASIQSGRKLTA
jgi:hypothetical protein